MRSRRIAIARIGVSASSHDQIALDHRTTGAEAGSPSVPCSPGPPERRGGRTGTPWGASAKRERSVGSRS
ncbi:MAG: hypothetical protein E6G41_09160 [Actinobacteria bacterium]|nr:MAG: hypothetical protein E6G41_09160 [Actinomycetota bacterium]